MKKRYLIHFLLLFVFCGANELDAYDLANDNEMLWCFYQEELTEVGSVLFINEWERTNRIDSAYSYIGQNAKDSKKLYSTLKDAITKYSEDFLYLENENYSYEEGIFGTNRYISVDAYRYFLSGEFVEWSNAVIKDSYEDTEVELRDLNYTENKDRVLWEEGTWQNAGNEASGGFSSNVPLLFKEWLWMVSYDYPWTNEYLTDILLPGYYGKQYRDESLQELDKINYINALSICKIWYDLNN